MKCLALFIIASTIFQYSYRVNAQVNTAPDSLIHTDTVEQAIHQSDRWIAFLATGRDYISVAQTNVRQIPLLGLTHLFTQDYTSALLYGSAEVGLYFLQEYFLDKTYEYLVEWNRSAVNDANHWYRRPGMSDLYNRYESFYNFNIQLSGFVTNADAFTSYRDNHSRLKNPRVKMTDESVGSLLLSPVKWRHLSNPWVYVPIGVFALGSWFGMDKLANSDKIDRITVIDKQYPRTDALVRSSSIAFVKYGLVAIQEEMMYRGILQTELTELTNPTAGIILSSAIFSTMHLFHNDVSTAVGAFLGGLYMGYRYYASGYDLGEPIAFHFYANFITTCISAIRNPKEGMYVYAISWKF